MTTFFQRGQIFKIVQVDNFRFPTLYRVEDLLGEGVEGNFYREQLRISPYDPSDNDYWVVEKVVKTRVRQGKKEYFVKFLHYPGKFRY